jgi:hypothetical protein
LWPKTASHFHDTGVGFGHFPASVKSFLGVSFLQGRH